MRCLMLLLLLAISTSAYTQSCCCTGAGANYTILPNLNRHLIGVRYSYKNFYNQTHSLNPDVNGLITNQHLQTLELAGRFNLIDRLQLSVLVPVNIIVQQAGGKSTQTAGLGDMSLLLQYNLLNPLKCNGKKTKHQLRLGAGTKLPSGDFRKMENDLFLTNLQLGTGSIDFVGNAVYTFRINQFGFNATALYKFNTANTQGYQFGSRVQTGLMLFYLADINGVQLMPSAAVNYEYQMQNKNRGRLLSFTGGQFVNTTLGFDIYYKNFAFTSAITPALMNQLNWKGENKNRLSAEVGVFYNFSTKTKNN